MHSYLQYRKIGLAVERQLERDQEKAQALSLPRHATGTTTSHLSETSSDESTANEVSEGVDAENNPDILKTTKTRHSERTALGHALDGIHARERTTKEGKGPMVFVVGWENEHDPLDPHNRSHASRLITTLIVASIAFVVGAASSIDTAIAPQASAEFGVSDVVESLATGKYIALN